MQNSLTSLVEHKGSLYAYLWTSRSQIWIWLMRRLIRVLTFVRCSFCVLCRAFDKCAFLLISVHYVRTCNQRRIYA